MTTKFERDMQSALEGAGVEVITTRREEIEDLTKKLNKCKDAAICKVRYQEIMELKAELEQIESLF